MPEKMAQTTTRSRRTKMGRKIWSWPVIGAVVLLLLGTGVSFMTSTGLQPHVLIADCLYIAAAVLFAVKFVTWEEAKHQTKQKRFIVSAASVFGTIIITGFLIGSNHYLNRRPKAQASKDGTENCTAGKNGDATASGSGNIANSGNCNNIDTEKKSK